jgi:HAMP domain-containing protein
MKLRNLLIILFLFTSLANILIGGLLYYFSNLTIAKNNTSQSLLAVTESKAEHIKTYFNMEIDNLKLISSRTQLRVDIINYNKDPSLSIKEAIRLKLSDAKNSVPNYKRLCYVNNDGKVVTCDDASLNGQDFSQDEFFVNGKIKEGIHFFDHTAESHADIVTSGPLISNGELLGVIISFESFDELEKIVNNRTGLEETGEALVAYQNKDTGQIIYPLPRLFTNTNTSATPGEPMKQALFGNELIFQDSLDYRGVPVIAVSHYIDIADMGLVVKMDIAEVAGEYEKSLILNTLIFGSVGLLISLTISLILSYYISKPLNQLKTGAEIIGGGNLDFKINVKTNDEIGRVAQTFNEMSAKLKTSYANLEEKVKDRTFDLEQRTKELEQKTKELEGINNLMIDRELKMIELKKEFGLDKSKNLQNQSTTDV